MRVFLSDDWMHYLWSRQNQEIDKEKLQNFIRQFKNTTITDFCFNVDALISPVKDE
jgi:hypothetical protein